MQNTFKNDPWVEYTCNSHHRYGKEYCTPHRIHESQLDEVIYDEVKLLLIKIQEQSKKYDKIVHDWQRQKPAYERKIEQYKARLLVKTVYVHQNEDKSLDVRLEFNGYFEDSVAVYVEGESA